MPNIRRLHEGVTEPQGEPSGNNAAPARTEVLGFPPDSARTARSHQPAFGHIIVLGSGRVRPLTGSAAGRVFRWNQDCAEPEPASDLHAPAPPAAAAAALKGY